MKKIALVIFDYFEYGGIQKDLDALGKMLRKLALERGIPCELTLLCMRNRSGKTPGWCDHLEELSPAWYELSNHRRAMGFDRKIADIKAEKRFDLLVGFNRIGNLDFYFAGDDCLKERYQYRPLASRLLSRARNFLELERRVFQLPASGGAEKIFVITEKQKESFLRFYPECDPERLILMPPNLAEEFFDRSGYETMRRETRQKWNIADDELFIIQIAAAFHTKGVDRSLAILGKSKASGRLKKFRFLVAGGSSPRVIKAMETRAGGAGLAPDEVVFCGPRQDIRELLCAADLMIHPARAESAGSVLIEALSCGVPVLSGAVCGYNSFLEDAGSGVIIPEPFDASEAVELFEKTLLKLPELKRDASGFAANNIVPEKFQRARLEAELILNS